MDETQDQTKLQPDFGPTQRIIFGMGCFWSPEALFGHMPGVVRTRVGYSGGHTPNPTYRDMGDHTETVLVEFAPALLPFRQIVNVFWDRHNPYNINDYKGRQYQSLLLYEDETQRADIETVLEERRKKGLERPDTEIRTFSTFYPAEERHQKYYLKRFPHAFETVMSIFGEHDAFNDSTLAARLNGLAKGYTSLERIKAEIGTWNMGEKERAYILDEISSIRW
ncbi:peptide-methionine (S)-S-oxide reductase MsrA [Paenibacillus soyae]|uniref:Peptide methionine sulfoxide reductase MsrA n=1 Tax=Paenibacillus soyae TaxID=2969249 RepID=A0A9X2MPZ6_9BACL|nr:peptide-methionine (S)-S-oxide reductase MsrA [Paenibacillus soyae]